MRLFTRSVLAFLLFLSVISLKHVHGQRLVGSEIGFEKLDSTTYRIQLITYTLCNYPDFVMGYDGYLKMKMQYSPYSEVSLSPTLISVRDISYYHDTVASCQTGGSLFGIEETVYWDTLDFANDYSSYYTNSAIHINFTTITRMLGGTNLNTSALRMSRNYAEIYPKKNLQKGVFNNEPLFMVGLNRPLFTTNNANPNNGVDSVVHNFGCPLGPGGVSYGYIHSGLPFQAYYPGSLTLPYANPSASPPIGITTNLKGELIYTPTENGAQDNYVIEANLYSPNDTGVMEYAGKVRRELFHFNEVHNNNAPRINGPFNYNVCEGETLCFNITTGDQYFILPPPGGIIIDSTKITWDSALADLGATFSVDSGTRLQTGQFCWTPSIGTTSNQAYYFEATVNDQHGPVNGRAKRGFFIHVKPRAFASTSLDSLQCNTRNTAYVSRLNADSNVMGTPQFWQTIYNDSGSILDSKALFFKSTGFMYSQKQQDTLIGDTTGTFIIQYVFNAAPNNCPTSYWDTVNLSIASPSVGSRFRDTTYCDVISDSLAVSGTWSSISWSTGANTKAIYIDTPNVYRVNLIDSCGVEYTYYADIQLKTSPDLDFDDQYVICSGDSLELEYSHPEEFEIEWSTQDTVAEITLKDSNAYWVEVQNFCAVERDSFELAINEEPDIKIAVDSSVCDELTYSPIVLKGAKNSIFWEQDSVVSYSPTITSTQQELIELTSVNQCGTARDSSFLQPIEAPLISFSQDSLEGCSNDSFIVSPSGNHSESWLWSNGETGPTSVLKTAGTHYVTNSVYCGSVYDSIEVVLSSGPRAVAGKDTFLCAGETINLEPEIVYPNATIWWNNQAVNPFPVTSGGTYILTVFNACGFTKDTVEVEELDLPMPNLGNDTIVEKYIDQPFTFDLDAGEADSYLWSTGDSTKLVTVSDTGTYWVEATNKCGTTADTISILDTTGMIGIAKYGVLEYKIFPNPASSQLNVELSQPGNSVIRISDMLGRELLNFESEMRTTKIDVTSFNPGTYIIEVKQESTFGVKRFTLE